MKDLFIKKIEVDKKVDIEEAAHILETRTVTNPIDVLNWEDYSYRPDLKFRIGHTDKEIWLKYYVKEEHILAQETNTNGAVHKDSCAEFFISVDGKNYYNLEINCIGTIHLAHGEGRASRRFVDPKTIEKIRVTSTLGNQPFKERSGNFEWEMMICFPVECFAFDNLTSLSGRKATANFYKCGDDTTKPHFVTWNPVETENPDYHRPEYFGKLRFE